MGARAIAGRDDMSGNWREEMLGSGGGPIPVRIYRGDSSAKRPPLVLHLHSGTFLDGTLSQGELVAKQLADAGAVVIAADYSHASAAPFPEALNYSFNLLGQVCHLRAKLADRKSTLYVAGEEAGGNLAAGLALMARDQCMSGLQGQILLSPMLDPCMATGSFRKAETNPKRCRWADGWNRYLGFAANACHPYAVPAYCERLAGLAPALVVTATDDPLHDESLAYARRLRLAGVRVTEHVLPGPTGWPSSFAGSAENTETGPSWTEKIRNLFAKFFQETGAQSA